MYGYHRFGFDILPLNKIPFTVRWFLGRKLLKSDVVLDLGCGPVSLLRFLKVRYSIGVDLFKPYLIEARRLSTHSEFVMANCTNLEFKERSFDVVLAFNIIEHLDKQQGLELIKKAKRWARKAVILSIPNGFTPGIMFDDNPLQLHRAGYSVKELKKLGFQVRGIGIKIPGYCRWHIVRGATYPLRIITYWNPSLAYDLLAYWHC